MRISKFFSNSMMLFFSVCIIFSFLCQIFNVTALVNTVYLISLLVVLFCYILSGSFNRITLLMTLLIAVASVVNGVVYTDVDYFTHVLITLCIFICIEMSSKVKISKSTFKIISVMFLITSIILVVAYYLGPLKRTYFDNRIGSVCLNFKNPNTAGLWVTCLFILLLYSSFLYTGLKRLLYISVAVAMLPIIIATQSRNSFLACIFFVAGLIATKYFKIQRVPNFVLKILAVLPLLVFAFYMFVIIENMDFWEEIFKIQSINKGIGTRRSMWQRVIDDSGRCFLFGQYPTYFNSQMHNSLLTIFCRFGAPVTGLACISIYYSLKNLQDNCSLYAALSLGAIFFTGCFEASVFVGIAGMYLMLVLIPACASVENVDQPRRSRLQKRK